MSKKEWYASAEHFNTEESYNEYIKKLIKEMKKKETKSLSNNTKSPLNNTEPKRAMK